MAIGLTKRGLLTAALATGALRATAQTTPTIRIGVLNDQSSAYRDNGGVGSVACVKLAVAELASKLGINAEVISVDHQGKVDVAVATTRQWLDDGVDAVCDLQNSAVALAINDIIRQRDKVMLAFNVGISDITGRACTPNVVHWAFDSQMLARVAATALVKQGADTWFFIRADYTFGKTMQDDATTFITQAGGRVLGSIAMPFPSTDFAAALLQAQASGAKVIGLANAGSDLVNVVKQAGEFGITQRGQRLASLLVFINNVHAIGLEGAQGLVLSETFYWDRNDASREFTKRVLDAGFPQGAKPNMAQAGCYVGTRHYLRAIASLGAAEAKRSGSATVARWRVVPARSEWNRPWCRCWTARRGCCGQVLSRGPRSSGSSGR